MEQLVSSAGFATILNVVTAITLLGVGLQMCVVVVRIYLSLRAKVRAQEALHRAVMLDKRFRAVVNHATKQKKLDAKESERLRGMIEAHLKQLSKRDRQYVHEGLHQQSARGAERYAYRLLSGA